MSFSTMSFQKAFITVLKLLSKLSNELIEKSIHFSTYLKDIPNTENIMSLSNLKILIL